MNVNKRLNKFIKSLQQSGILEWVEKLQKKFPEAEVYLVGGAVRDAILGVEDKKDYDFVVRKVPLKKLEKFLSKLGWVELLGRSFGVLKFRPKGLSYKDNKSSPESLDIALPRKEVSIGQGGYKDFKVKFDKDLNIEQDLLRRDFTINAVALCLGFNVETCHGASLPRIIDPFNGISDIKNKKIRCVGDTKERLSEDYTRILRAVRFACQLDFKIVPEVKKVIKKLAPHLNDKDRKGEFISPREVIAKELLRAFSEDYLRAIEVYDELGLFKVLMPEILKMKKCPQPKKFHTEGDVWQHTMMALQNIESSDFERFERKLDRVLPISNFQSPISSRLELILVIFLHDIGKPVVIQTPKKDGVDRIRFNNHDNAGAELVARICKRLTLSAPQNLGIDCDNLAWLVRKHMMLVHGHPTEFRPNTIEKYFFSNKYPGKNLIKLAWLDVSATITAKGPLKYDLINILLKRIKKMKSLVKKKKDKQNLPEPLLNGNEIMKICKLKPGKVVGEIKDKLREKQLSGEIKSKEEAKGYIKEIKGYKKK